MTLIEDKLYARFSAAGKTRDGYVRVLDYGCTHPASGFPSQRLGLGCETGRQGEQKYVTGRVRLRWDAPDDAWRVEAQWLNLTDEVYYIDAYDVSISQGTTIMQPGVPMTWNLSFQRNF
jgi:hypothetical protein